jgi:hypothetical protein
MYNTYTLAKLSEIGILRPKNIKKTYFYNTIYLTKKQKTNENQINTITRLLCKL